MQGTQASTEFWKQGVKSGLSVCTDRLESWGQRKEFRGSLVQLWAHAPGRGLGQRAAMRSGGQKVCEHESLSVQTSRHCPECELFQEARGAPFPHIFSLSL